MNDLKLIKLTTVYDVVTYVNIQHIIDIFITPRESDTLRLCFTDGSYIVISEQEFKDKFSKYYIEN